MAFGQAGAFPFQFGGGTSESELVSNAIAQEFGRYNLDVSDGSVKAAEAYAYGEAIANVWSGNRRLAGAEVPLRMMETLPTWEEILRLRPSADDSDTARRQAVAAKLRALSGQMTFGDIEDICRAVMGPSFVQLTKADPSDYLTYLPGGGGPALAALNPAEWGTFAPGKPGFEHATNRCQLAIVVKQGILSNSAYAKLKAALQRLLHSSLPAYITFEIGEGTAGFVCNVGVLDVTFI